MAHGASIEPVVIPLLSYLSARDVIALALASSELYATCRAYGPRPPSTVGHCLFCSYTTRWTVHARAPPFVHCCPACMYVRVSDFQQRGLPRHIVKRVAGDAEHERPVITR